MDQSRPEKGATRLKTREGEDGRRDAIALGARLRRQVIERGRAIREGLAAYLASSLLALLALAFVLAALLSPGCGPVVPRAEASILECRKIPGPPALARVTYRLTVGEGPGIGRYCLTIHIKTDARDYWASDLVEEGLPGGAGLSCQKDLELEGEDEKILAYLIEDFWWE